MPFIIRQISVINSFLGFLNKIAFRKSRLNNFFNVSFSDAVGKTGSDAFKKTDFDSSGGGASNSDVPPFGWRDWNESYPKHD